MRRMKTWCLCLLVGATAVASGLVTARETRSEPAQAAVAVSEPNDKDAESNRVDGLLRRLGERVKTNRHFRFRVVETMDDVQDDGLKIQRTHVRSGVVSRPDKLRFETTGDVTNRTLWKDGAIITIWDKGMNVYVQVEDPGTIDDMLDTLLEKYGVSMPVADLLSEDIVASLTEGNESAEYIGMGLAGEELCHHLAFRRADIDWQLWVRGEDAALRKLVIDYKQLTGAPQFTLLALESETIAAPDEGVFRFKAPQGAEKIDIQPKQSEQE